MSYQHIYIHKESTARFEAFVRHINKFSQNILTHIVTEINEIPKVLPCNSICVILGENDIVKYGDIYRQQFGLHRCLFPNTENMQLETSKLYCREYIQKNISELNPVYDVIDTNIEYDNYNFVDKVIKADGLASGKGVFVYNDHYNDNDAAIKIINNLLCKHSKILIEQKLVGEEFSLISIRFSNKILHFPIVKDFKRLNDGNVGPNTGGMGTITFEDGSMPFLTSDDLKYCHDINEFILNDLNYIGFLYSSYMKTHDDIIKLIEINCRLGDSEAVNILGLLNVPLADFLFCNDVCYDNSCFDKAYTYFRYIVPSGYPHLTEIYNDSYFVIDSLIPYDVFYKANCTKLDNCNVYAMGCSRACGIFTKDMLIDNVVKYNDMYTKMIYGKVSYRTDIGEYFNTKKLSYINHLTNYNNIIGDIKTHIDKTNDIICKKNPSFNLIGKMGDFANSIQYKDIKLICSVDGAGTKTKFLEGNPQRFDILGSDVVVHNINDMLCNRGTPIGFLDYFGCSRLDKAQFDQYIYGISNVCQDYEIPLIGGETAEMKGIYIENQIEVMGILIGFVKDNTHNGLNIKKGNYIYGIKSNGAHTNGYTKLRDIDDKYKMPSNVKDFFSQKHKCYWHIIKNMLDCNTFNINGLSHITGGGFVDNIGRILPNNLTADNINLINWEENLCDEWKWVYSHSEMNWADFIKVFNAGYGFAIITETEIPSKLLKYYMDNEIELIGYIS